MNWYVEVVDTTSRTNKFTVNSNTGRITVKISDQTSVEERDKLITFAGTLKEQNWPSVTMRGRIRFDHSISKYGCQFISESEKIKKMVKM